MGVGRWAGNLYDTITVEPEGGSTPESDAAGGYEHGTYADSHYLLFGGNEDFLPQGALDTLGTRAYLTDHRFNEGQLSQTRRHGRVASLYEGYHMRGESVCDFCGRTLSGVEYERLRDGRDRCMTCSRAVVRGAKSIEALYWQTRESLCQRFGITLDVDIAVKITSAAKIARAEGKTFVPTPGFDSRAVGLAIKRGKKISVLLENGTPRLSLITTTAHELTHVWQYTHWDLSDITKRYGKLERAVYEGMAKWTELQYLYLLNETTQADRSFAQEVRRTDVYGFGLRCFLKKYPISRGITLSGDTPFNHLEEPIPMSMLL